jgi:hypothetical protein
MWWRASTARFGRRTLTVCVTGEMATGLVVTVAIGVGMDKQLQADESKGLALKVPKQAGLATGVDLDAGVARFWRAVVVKQAKSGPKAVKGTVTVSARA